MKNGSKRGQSSNFRDSAPNKRPSVAPFEAPNDTKELSPVGEAWLKYEFTLKDDPTRAVKVAVLCFHYP